MLRTVVHNVVVRARAALKAPAPGQVRALFVTTANVRAARCISVAETVSCNGLGVDGVCVMAWRLCSECRSRAISSHVAADSCSFKFGSGNVADR